MMRLELVRCKGCNADCTRHYFVCDMAIDDEWCPDCFTSHPCEKSHGEGCATQGFGTDDPEQWTPERGTELEEMRSMLFGAEAAEKSLAKENETLKRLLSDVIRLADEFNFRHQRGTGEYSQLKDTPPICNARAYIARVSR